MPETAPKTPSETSKSEIIQKDRDLPTLLLLLLLAVIVFGIFLFDPKTSVISEDSQQDVREGMMTAYSIAESEAPKIPTRMADFFRYVSEYPGGSAQFKPEPFGSEIPASKNPAVPEVSTPSVPLPVPLTESASGSNVPSVEFVSNVNKEATSPVTLQLGEYSFEFS